MHISVCCCKMVPFLKYSENMMLWDIKAQANKVLVAVVKLQYLLGRSAKNVVQNVESNYKL